MYQEVILDHYKHPHHRGLREPFGAQVHHVNPTCGDEVTLRVSLSKDGERVTDVIEDQMLNALVGTGLVNEIKINWVWNPPWGPDKITDDGREQLRALGFTV